MAYVTTATTGGLVVSHRSGQSGADYIRLETSDLRAQITLDASEAEQLLRDIRTTLDKIKADRIATVQHERLVAQEG